MLKIVKGNNKCFRLTVTKNKTVIKIKNDVTADEAFVMVEQLTKVAQLIKNMKLEKTVRGFVKDNSIVMYTDSKQEMYEFMLGSQL